MFTYLIVIADRFRTPVCIMATILPLTPSSYTTSYVPKTTPTAVDVHNLYRSTIHLLPLNAPSEVDGELDGALSTVTRSR